MNPAMPTRGWNQIMTLPRKLTLSGEEDVLVEPAGDVESLRGAHHHVGSTTLPANQEVVLKNVGGNAIEIVAEIDTGNASAVELDVLRSPGKEEVTRIIFYRGRGLRNPENGQRSSLVSIDSTHSSSLPEDDEPPSPTSSSAGAAPPA